MRRLMLAGAVLLAGLSLQTTSALAADQHGSLKDFVCHPAVKPAKRIVSVTAVMRPIPGTVRLSMRFQLLGTKSGILTAMRGGDLDTWISPSPITLGQRPGDVWILKHPVTGVPVGTKYSFRVSFRWMGAGGRRLASSSRSTASCWQPYVGPDLLVESISVGPAPNDSTQNQYVVWIANAGLTAASSFQVAFTTGGGTAPNETVAVPHLGPHKTVSETFTGPACTATNAPTITVDPGQQVPDADRANNSKTASCPELRPQGLARLEHRREDRDSS